MRINPFKIAAASLLAAAIVVTPLHSRAEDSTKTPASADETAPAKEKKKGTAFTGEMMAVDTNAMTFTVSNLVLHVTSSTAFKKGSQPAKFADAVVGQPTRGTYLKNAANGQLEAVQVHLNSKAGNKGKGGAKKKKETSGGDGATNGVSIGN